MVTMLAAVSVIAAVFCAALLWRVVREERQRSEARVAALSSAIDGPRSASTSPSNAAPQSVENGTASLEPGSAGPRSARATLFQVGQTSPMQGRPLLKVAIGFVMAIVLTVLIAMSGDRQHRDEAVSMPEASPLELVSMRHARAGDAFTVTGLVRNPGSATAGRVSAVVLAFDRAGDFIGSARGPLEFPTLGQGEESPFKITIPNVGDVGRYRVSFRTESGVVRHVDLRAGAKQIAAK